MTYRPLAVLALWRGSRGVGRFGRQREEACLLRLLRFLLDSYRFARFSPHHSRTLNHLTTLHLLESQSLKLEAPVWHASSS